MWYEKFYDNDVYDPYEQAFEIADFERRFKRERQFEIYDDYFDNGKPPKLTVSLLVLQNGIVKLNFFLDKN